MLGPGLLHFVKKFVIVCSCFVELDLCGEGIAYFVLTFRIVVSVRFD